MQDELRNFPQLTRDRRRLIAAGARPPGGNLARCGLRFGAMGEPRASPEAKPSQVASRRPPQWDVPAGRSSCWQVR